MVHPGLPTLRKQVASLTLSLNKHDSFLEIPVLTIGAEKGRSHCLKIVKTHRIHSTNLPSQPFLLAAALPLPVFPTATTYLSNYFIAHFPVSPEFSPFHLSFLTSLTRTMNIYLHYFEVFNVLLNYLLY